MVARFEINFNDGQTESIKRLMHGSDRVNMANPDPDWIKPKNMSTLRRQMRKRFLFSGILAAAAAWMFVSFWSPDQIHGVESNQQNNRWESAIEEFEASDKTNPPPQNSILFVGSSSIRFWPDLQRAFPGHKVFKRGFGGSELSDSVAFVDRIVIPYKPKIILLYAGDNDLAAGKSPEQIFSDFKMFAQKVHVPLPQTYIGYIAIKPCPARIKLLGEVKTTNRLIKEYAGPGDKLLFIDVFTPMLDKDGGLRPELFIQDGLHLNEKGYALWDSIIKPVLDKYDAP
ncbi:MAG: SGNH/GDSL hydrolase family protein [Verrucomicrobiota bacterium]|jgi:lysophospholipase L1-like esterase